MRSRSSVALVCSLLLLLSVSAVAGERSVVRISIASRAEVDFVAQWSEPWEVSYDEGWLITDVDDEGLLRLEELGFRPQILTKETAKYNRPLEALPGQTEGIPGYPCYRTVEETLTTGADLAALYPDLAQWIDIGNSWQKTQDPVDGYDLMLLKITNSAIGGDKPDLYVEGAIHSRELVTAELVTRFAEHVLANYGVDPDITWIVDHHELHLLLQTNPDGRKNAEAGDWWRKNTNETTCGSPSDWGVDLNRNFWFEWGCCGGSSSNGCDDTYRGISAASEPETIAVQDYVRANFNDNRPDDLTTPAPLDSEGIFIDVHSYGGDVLSSWGFTSTDPPNGPQILTLGRKFAYFTDYDARLGSLYSVDGSTKDFGYGELGLASYTWELGTEFFQDCSPFESTIYPDNLDALVYAAKVPRAPYMLPYGPDVLGAVAAPSIVAPGALVQVNATADDTRYESGSGEPTQPIFAADLYVDTPPWDPAAAPIAMSAADGSFNHTVEGLTATLDTTGLADGRHLLYLQAEDSLGNRGPVSAVFLWVMDPATSPRIEGLVTSLADGSPLEATVVAQDVADGTSFTVGTDPADGSYSLMVLEGTYDVTATSSGYAAATVAGVLATSGTTATVDLQLEPIEGILIDDVENGNLGWTDEGGWGITDEDANSPTHSWTDSPGVNYGSNWNYSLISPPLDLRFHRDVTLQFAHAYDIEDGYDYGYVEVSSDNGGSWTTVATYTDVAPWETVTVPVPQIDFASAARVRFRLETDFTVTRDGWYVDDIVVNGVEEMPQGLLFMDSFESGDTSAWSEVVP